jgi:hypothetical protein
MFAGAVGLNGYSGKLGLFQTEMGISAIFLQPAADGRAG